MACEIAKAVEYSGRRGYPEFSMPLLSRTKSRQLFEKLSDLEAQMHKMQGEIAVLHDRQADDEVESVAAERVRSDAAKRTEDGAKALADLGIRIQ
jgi:hypothetical protein